MVTHDLHFLSSKSPRIDYTISGLKIARLLYNLAELQINKNFSQIASTGLCLKYDL